MYSPSQSWACSASKSLQQSKSPITLDLFPCHSPSSAPTPNYFSLPSALPSIRNIDIFKPSLFTPSSSNASLIVERENQEGGENFLIGVKPMEYTTGESNKTGATYVQMLSSMPMKLGTESSSSNVVKEKLGGDYWTFHAEDQFLLSSSKAPTNQVWSDAVPHHYSEVVPNCSQLTSFPASNELVNCQPPKQESEVKPLKVVVWKHLTKTDVSRTGRIIIPKIAAETGLPVLDRQDRMTLLMGDLFSGNIWAFRYRFWTNENSRIYVLEKAGPYIRRHQLQMDNLFIIYKDQDSETYYVGTWREIPPPNLMGDNKDKTEIQQLVEGGNEREICCQLCHKPVVQYEER